MQEKPAQVVSVPLLQFILANGEYHFAYYLLYANSRNDFLNHTFYGLYSFQIWFYHVHLQVQ